MTRPSAGQLRAADQRGSVRSPCRTGRTGQVPGGHLPHRYEMTRQDKSMGEPDGFEAEDDYTNDCPECGGEGGYAVCCEDCCPHIYGEDGCDDPACWRRCSVCRGKGYLQ